MRVHATAVAIAGRAVLLLGPPGSGKSDLALRLIDRGARLIADDQVEIVAVDGRLLASPPLTIAGRIEVRSVGIVAVGHVSAVPVALLVDLAGVCERMPEPATRALAGCAVPLIALRAFEGSAPLKVERALTAVGLGVEAKVVAPSAPQPNMVPSPSRVLLVTGMSGAGRSTALKALEDMGYEAVDNLPLSLFEKLLATTDGTPEHDVDRPLAIGIDSRTRAFDAEDIVARIADLRGEGVDVTLMFLDCSGGELTRRFSETRRRHPLALDRPATDGIAREREMLSPLRRAADVVIDTTDYAAADLRRALLDRFARPGVHALTVTITSFGFARGVPRDADLVFDVRFLANPHWDAELRPLTGEDPRVGAYVAADPAFSPAFERIADLLLTLLPSYGREGKSYLTVAFGCTGGRHRSVYVARAMAERLATSGWDASVVHRDKAGHGNDAALPAAQTQQTA